MSRAVVHTPGAPAAVGAYSQAVSAAGVVYCSGQVPLDPSTGELIGNTIREQTRRCLDNIAAILEAAGTDLARVVKVTVYLTEMGEFTEFNETYAQYFTSDPPARSTVEVAALPKGARIEIDCTALV
jgi:2-iminobutanoate/2-iminopropanoate deaminase